MSQQAVPTDFEKIQLERLRVGNVKAFDFFYDRYSLPIYRKILKMIKVEFVAEEILQNVFIKIWEKRHLIDPEKGLRPYLYQIAHNLVYDFYRNLAREEKFQSEVRHTIAKFSQASDEKILFDETKELLEKAIGMLPDQQRLVFRLCKQEGKSYDEVSEILGISTSTINGHIVKATKKVKTFMFQTHRASFKLVLPALLCFIEKNI
jgi:RNA polymerase sigma-70 factor (family 1)